MKAVVVDPSADTDPIRVQDWPDPEPPPGWVVVRVARAGLNRNDAMMVARRRELLPRPSVIGSDAAGTVVALGDGATGVEVGTEVVVSPGLWWGPDDEAAGPDFDLLGDAVQGTHAELLTVPAENVHPRPGRLTLDQAAALPLAGVTAWRALVTRGRLAEGHTVVVTAASSGVGTFAVQIAVALGARVVAVTSSPAKQEAALGLGAHAVVSRRSQTYAADLRDAVGPAGADLVLDSAGAEWGALLGALRRGGRLVNVGRNASRHAEIDLGQLFWEHLSVLGSSVGSPRDFQALLDHVEQTDWVPVVDEIVTVADAADAYQRLDSEERVGKVVLDLG